MAGEASLEEATEAVRGREGVLSGPERQEPVRVQRLEADRHLLRGRGHHARNDECREVVRHADGGVAPQGAEQALARVARGLDVRIVGDAGAAEPARGVGHAVQDEAVQPVRGPGIAGAQRLQDDQRLAELPDPLERAVQGEVPADPPVRGHPVQDEGPVGPDRLVVQEPDAQRGDDARGHQTWFRSMSSFGCGSR